MTKENGWQLILSMGDFDRIMKEVRLEVSRDSSPPANRPQSLPCLALLSASYVGGPYSYFWNFIYLAHAHALNAAASTCRSCNGGRIAVDVETGRKECVRCGAARRAM